MYHSFIARFGNSHHEEIEMEQVTFRESEARSGAVSNIRITEEADEDPNRNDQNSRDRIESDKSNKEGGLKSRLQLKEKVPASSGKETNDEQGLKPKETNAIVHSQEVQRR